MTPQLPDCMICREPGRARLIEADWASGRHANQISKAMTAAGWPVAAGTIIRHLKEHVPGAYNRTNEPLGTGRRNAAVFVKDRIMLQVESLERAERIKAENEGREPDLSFILAKDLQPALNTAIRAEGIEVKREDAERRSKIDVYKN